MHKKLHKYDTIQHRIDILIRLDAVKDTPNPFDDVQLVWRVVKQRVERISLCSKTCNQLNDRTHSNPATITNHQSNNQQSPVQLIDQIKKINLTKYQLINK